MGKRIVHVEFPAADGDRGERFWTELAGWSFNDAGMPGIDYRMFDGGGGWGGAVWTSEDAGEGPIVYLDSEDIDADVARVRELGGNSFSLYQGDQNAA